MDIYEKVKKEVEEKNRLKVGDVCAYVGNVPWFAYRNCVIHEVRDDGNYMVKFSDGGLEIVAPNELVKMPGAEWKEPNIASSLPYIPYDYKHTKNLLNGLHSSGTITMDNNTGGIKFVKEEEKTMKEEFEKGDRVVCIKQPNDSNHNMVGLKGTVLNVDSFGWIFIEFDDNIHGHDGCYPNNGKLGHCWGIKKEYLKLIDKEEEKNMLSFKIGDIVEILDGPGKGLHGKIIGCRGTLGSSDIEAVIDIDGDEYHFSTKRLKLVSKKDEKGEKKMMFNFKVVGAYPNKKKGILAVKFNDGEVIKLACHNDDNFDINVGVALAMAYKSCGSKNAFRRSVEKVTQEVKSKEDKEDKVFVEKKKRGRKRKKLVSAIPEYTFGYKMKKARKSKNLTQKELALIIGAGTSTIHNYERNDCLPNPKRRAKIIEVLGLN